MPELAEVEYHRKQWDSLVGQMVCDVHVNPRARIFREIDISLLVDSLRGARLKTSLRHGKRMRFDFAGDVYLGIQLGMTGAMRRLPQSQLSMLDRHDHLVLETAKDLFVFRDSRMFGLVRYAHDAESLSWWPDDKPDVGSSRYTFERMNAFLMRRQQSPIKNVLLDQEGFPGVGNWMADEICWRARIDPRMRCIQLSDAEREALFEAVREVAVDALRVIGKDYSTPPNDWLFTHRWKDGGNCPRPACKAAPLRREKIAGRTACYCPECQE